MGDTSIEWSDKVWNPVTGCTKVSPGCKHCYAERVFPRAYSGQCKCGHTYDQHFRPELNTDHREPCKICDSSFGCLGFQPRKFTDVRTHSDRLEQPLHWRKPARIFVNSMSDLFHEDVPMGFVMQVFAIMAIAEQHTFQILTKRPVRMLEMLTANGVEEWVSESACKILDLQNENWRDWLANNTAAKDARWPLPNVWLGVSVENKDTLHRIDTLKDVHAAIRFVSFEPLLEDLGAVILDGIHWAIIGGESGQKARPMCSEWARSIIAQCRLQHVAPFFKQFGSHPVIPRANGSGEEWPAYTEFERQDDYYWRVRLEDNKGGDMSEWPSAMQVREFPS